MAQIVFFAFDISEASQVRRIESIESLGFGVASYSFRRGNMNTGFSPGWPDVSLGSVSNEAHLRRAVQLLPAIVRAVFNRRPASASTLWIARNLDLLVIAHAVRLITFRLDVRIAYECLDVHRLLTRPDRIGRVLRWVERRLLNRSAALIVSSPGFVREYFQSVQGYEGPVVLIENKLWFGDRPIPRPTKARKRPPGAALVIGSVGSIRCAASLRMLAEVAERLGPEVEIAFHGNVHSHAVPDFDRVIARHPNMTWHGPYRYPSDLEPIYAGCDLVWAQDLWQNGANSDWLLPNRIYEASWFGCPSIAVSDRETGRRVVEAGLGFAIKEASADALVRLLQAVERDEIEQISQAILESPDRMFRLFPDEIAARLAPILPYRLAEADVVQADVRPVN